MKDVELDVWPDDVAKSDKMYRTKCWEERGNNMKICVIWCDKVGQC